MTQYKPIPQETIDRFLDSLPFTLPFTPISELIEALGEADKVLGPSAWTAHTPGKPDKIISYSKSLVYLNATPLIKEFIIHIREDKAYGLEFRGEKLPDENNIS
jgi:hypothetical protein